MTSIAREAGWPPAKTRSPARRASPRPRTGSRSLRRADGSRPAPGNRFAIGSRSRRARPWPGGLFELRKDRHHRLVGRRRGRSGVRTERFYRPAEHIGQTPDECPNCDHAAGDDGPGACAQAGRVHRRRHRDAKQGSRRRTARSRSLGLVGDVGSWQTIVAPRGHHESLAETTPQIAFEHARPRARCPDATRATPDKTEYLQVVQNCGRQAGALTDHLCLDFYDLPQIPHRIGEELGGAARYVIREGDVPVLSPRPRRGRQSGAARLRGRGERLFRAVCVALAVRAVGRAAPPRRGFRHGHATRSSSAPRTRCRASCSCLSTLAEGPAYNLILHTAPLQRARRRDVSLALGDPSPTARDRRARAGHRACRSTRCRPKQVDTRAARATAQARSASKRAWPRDRARGRNSA